MNAVVTTRRKGTDAAEYLQIQACAPDDPLTAIAVAERRAKTLIAWAMKSAVDPTTTADMGAFQTIGSDLSLAINEASAYGALLPLANRVPFHTRTLSATTPAVSGWGGERTPIRGTAAGFTETGQHDVYRVASLSVQTKELVTHSSSPSSTEAVRRLIVSGNALAIDAALLDPSNGGTPGSKPASITNGATAFALASMTVASFDAAFASCFGEIIDNGGDLKNTIVFAHPRAVVYLATARGTSGPAFPGVNAKSGGTIYGVPLVPTRGLPLAGSPSGTSIAVVDATGISIADESEADFAVTTQASVELEDTPDGTAQPLLDLWQNDLVGLKVVRYLSFIRARAHSVAVISGVTI